MRLLLILFSFALLTACDSVTEQGDPAPTMAPDAVRSEQLADYIKVTVSGGDPEKYIIQFSWPKIEDQKIIRIRLETVLTEVQPSQTFFTHQVSHNQNLTYFFDVLGTDKKIERTISKSVKVPTDFLVKLENQFISADSEIKVNRVYLKKDFPLYIQSHNITIFASEIHSDQGSIQTFQDINAGSYNHKSPEAPAGSPGRSGGTLIIKAHDLYGPLNLVFRGEKGGQGGAGPAFINRAAQGSEAGGGKTYNSEQGYVCDERGADGGPGTAGKNGNTGLSGLQGGDTGNFKLSIQNFKPQSSNDPTYPNETTVPVDFIMEPGQGGDGGPGGPSQLGGLGGPMVNSDCSGNEGPEGPPGQPGFSGPSGPIGGIGTKCIYIGSENINDCAGN